MAMTQNTLPIQQRTISGEKWQVLGWPSQSTDLNANEHTFPLPKTKLKKAWNKSGKASQKKTRVW